MRSFLHFDKFIKSRCTKLEMYGPNANHFKNIKAKLELNPYILLALQLTVCSQ